MEGRPISDLKVAELRKELEKRNKDKTGVKQVLLDRLKEVFSSKQPRVLDFRKGWSRSSNLSFQR